MDTVSYLLGKQAGGGGADLSNYFVKEILPPEGSTKSSTQMIKRIPDDAIISTTTLESAFQYCTNLLEFPLLDTSNVTNMKYCFGLCTSLLSIPQLNTAKVTTMQRMFWNCNALVTVPILSTAKVTTMQDMFVNCYDLSNESLNNILQMCINTTSKYTSAKTLAYIGISSTQATTCQSLSNYQDFISAGWTTGY